MQMGYEVDGAPIKELGCDNVSTCNFGEHVTIDGYRGDFAKLNDRVSFSDALRN